MTLPFSQELVEEERLVLDSAVDKLEDKLFEDDDDEEEARERERATAAAATAVVGAFERAAAAARLEAAERPSSAAGATSSAGASASSAAAVAAGAGAGVSDAAVPLEQLTREQIADLAEAIDTMIDSPIRHEKEEMAELEAERVKTAVRIEEAKGASKQVAMLDSRVQSMMARIKAEMEVNERSIRPRMTSDDLR